MLTSSSMDDMLRSIEAQYETHFLHQSRFKVCAKHIRSFGDKFAPFFDVINIFVQTNPQYSGLVWGSLRLIYQLGSSYITFLEKLCGFFRKIADELPAYTVAIEALGSLKDRDGRQLDHRLLISLSWIYKDVVEFCYDAYRLLSNKKGFRGKSRVIWQISWRPFDDRFGHLLQRLRWHSELFRQEVAVAQIELGVAQLESASEQRDKLEQLYKFFEKEMVKMDLSRITRQEHIEREEEELRRESSHFFQP